MTIGRVRCGHGKTIAMACYGQVGLTESLRFDRKPQLVLRWPMDGDTPAGHGHQTRGGGHNGS